MILLDTDHIVILRYPENGQCQRLAARMLAAADQDFATTAITIEEQLRGWLAHIHRQRNASAQVFAYQSLLELFTFFSRWKLVNFDQRAAAEFDRLKKAKIRVGTMDLKIAAIALVHGATLLTANDRDFQLIPGLRVENWMA